MEAIYFLLGLAIMVGQVMAIIVCCRNQSPRWLKVCGAIGAILAIMALLGSV